MTVVLFDEQRADEADRGLVVGKMPTTSERRAISWQTFEAAADVFAKPPRVEHPAAANLLLAGTTAAETLHVTGASAGETIVLHGAPGAVGVSVLQQARLLDIHVIGTASPSSFETVRRFGGTPVSYGDGLESRLREREPRARGRPEPHRDDRRDATGRRGHPDHRGNDAASAAFRDAARARLIALAGEGELIVPIARTYPLTEAREALAFLQNGHPGGKLALLP